MYAILIGEPGGPEVLSLESYPTPEPGPGEVRVKVVATALNRADVLQRRGLYPPPEGASPVPGLEVAGVVDAVGEGVANVRPGDRVCGLLPGGGYAEYAVLPEALALPLPENLTCVQAAAVPEVFLTAYHALHFLGGLREGHRVLIHAGASGVGTAAIQLVREAGATALVTASAGKLDACRTLGATAAFDYRTENFALRVLEGTDGLGVNLILDVIGAPYLERNIRCLALDGRIVMLAFMGGRRVEAFDLLLLFRKRGSLITSTLRNRTVEEKAALTDAFARDAWPRFAEGRLAPVIDRIFDWRDVAEAHRYMEANRNVGKIVLQVAPEP